MTRTALSDEAQQNRFQGKRWFKDWWLLGLMLALIGFARFHHGLFDNPLDWDEANVLAMAKLPWQTMWHVIQIRDIHPPGWQSLEHVWVDAFGSSYLSVKVLAWLWGLAGIGLSAGLAYRLTASRWVAGMTALIVAFSPLHIFYSRLATPYGFYFAAGIASWWLFLNLMDRARDTTKAFWASGLLWGYVLLTAWTIQAHAAAPILLMSQGMYYLLNLKTLSKQESQKLLLSGGLVALTFLPHLWVILQPWHASKLMETVTFHQLISWPVFLFSPAILMFVGEGLRFLSGGEWVFYGGVAFFLLVQGVRTLRQLCPEWIRLIVAIGVFPWVCLYVVSLVTGFNVFQYRSLILLLFPLAFLSAFGLDACRCLVPKLAVVVLVGVLLLQGQSWETQRSRWFDRVYQNLAHTLQDFRKPEDGLVIIPGYHHLGIMAAIDPVHFGMAPQEQNFDPRRENVFNMVHRDDVHDLYISSTRLMEHPELLEKYVAFQKRHKRIWLLTHPSIEDNLLPLFTCGTDVVIQAPDGHFWIVRCPPDHARHCRAPIEKPSQWTCPNRP